MKTQYVTFKRRFNWSDQWTRQLGVIVDINVDAFFELNPHVEYLIGIYSE